MSVVGTEDAYTGPPRRLLTVSERCAACGKDDKPLALCRHCYVVGYCTEKCRKRAWRTHRCEPIVACAAAYDESGDDREPAATKLLERGGDGGSPATLYVGGVAALADGALMDRRVAAVVSLVTPKHLSRKAVARLVGADERHVARGQCYRASLYIAVEDDDEAPLGARLEQTAQFIDEWAPLGGVLVHCMAGHSRSATVAAYYVATRFLYPRSRHELRGPAEVEALADAAISHVRQHRPAAYPSDGFAAQLRAAVWEFHVGEDRRG